MFNRANQRKTQCSCGLRTVCPIYFFTKNEALNIEFKFAIDNHIPVLPLIQKTCLEEIFNKKCGDLQFFDKNNADINAISYDENKLQSDGVESTPYDDKEW